jgi:tRNA pseudouridine13 synthase
VVSLRASEEDFLVSEVPAYEPGGEGEHLYLHVEKRGLSTPELVRRLCSTFGLKEKDVGYAGRKDAKGITRQWLSVPARFVEARLEEVPSLGPVVVLEAKRHRNKLRLGHLRGNRFELRLEGEVDVAELEERAAALAERGTPNYFGSQRFGPDDKSIRQAERFLALGKKGRSRRDRFMVSVVQSALFNGWLSRRIEEDGLLAALDGDVMVKHDKGVKFICDDAVAETRRVRERELSVAGPLLGSEMRPAEREGMTWESRSLEEDGVDTGALMSHPAFRVGDRRASRLFAEDFSATAETDGARVAFTLGKGSYATVFLRELVGPALTDRAFDALDGGG